MIMKTMTTVMLKTDNVKNVKRYKKINRVHVKDHS